MNDRLVLPRHGLETEHVPVPARHAPRLSAMVGPEWLCVYEDDDPETYILTDDPVDVVP